MTSPRASFFRHTPPIDPRRNAGRDWPESAIRNGPANRGSPTPADSLLRLAPLSVFHHAAFSHFLDQADHPLSPIRCSTKLDPAIRAEVCRKRSNTERTQAYPSRESSSFSWRTMYPHPQRVQCPPKTSGDPAGRAPAGNPRLRVRSGRTEAQKVLLPDLVENVPTAWLDDFVLQRRDPYMVRFLPSAFGVASGSPDSSRRLAA